MERAEKTARMLDVTYQTSLLPDNTDRIDRLDRSERADRHDRAGRAEAAWSAVLGISELHGAYHARHVAISDREVMQFMVRDSGNLSSIAACLAAARENARAVRSALTT